MKNNKAMNLSQLAATGTALDLLVAEVQGVKVKRLRTRHARKGEGWSKANGAGRVVGAANGSNGVTTGNRAAAGGGQMTITGQCGQGAQMVDDLDAVRARYARVKAAEHREVAREEAALRRAEREAKAYAALDELLAEV